MPNQPKQFYLILTTGAKVPVRLDMLLNLQEVGMVRIGSSGIARIKRGCVGYQHEGTGEITFYVQAKTLIQNYSIKSSWKALLRAYVMKVYYVRKNGKKEPQHTMLRAQHDQVQHRQMW